MLPNIVRWVSEYALKSEVRARTDQKHVNNNTKEVEGPANTEELKRQIEDLKFALLNLEAGQRSNKKCEFTETIYADCDLSQGTGTFWANYKLSSYKWRNGDVCLNVWHIIRIYIITLYTVQSK